MKKLLIAIALLLLPSVTVYAQSCSTGACMATSCAESAVMAALPNSSAPATVIVTIPACSATTWTATLSYTIPSNVTNLTIQGAGAKTPSSSCTFAVGSACTTYSGTDQTEIVDGTSGNDTIWNITTGVSSSYFRLTGIAFTSSGTLNNGMLQINGASQNTRIDHCHFIGASTFSYNSIYYGPTGTTEVYGVADHNLFTDENGDENAIGVANGTSSGTYHGDTAWGASTQVGTNQYIYLENNVFDYSEVTNSHNAINDCVTGGRAVFRYNTILNGDFLTHPTGHAGEDRGCRAMEVYANTLVANDTSGNYLYDFFYADSGTALLWGNDLVTGSNDNSGYENLIILISARISESAMGYTQTATPNGWGYCGTTNGPSDWDGNLNSTGYPCLDDPARGGGDLLTGQSFPNVLNSVTDSIAWPAESFEPLYEWLNTWTPIGGYADTDYTNSGYVGSQNQDYFAYTSSFNGTSGVGTGTLANRPSTCTAGPGGADFTSPTGSFGVSYWATDKYTLYVCTSTNTWTAYYTPYIYPHPLDTTSSVGVTSGTMACAGGPPTYCAPQNWVAYPGSPVGVAPEAFAGNVGAGTVISSPYFGARIVRLTDMMVFGTPDGPYPSWGFSGNAGGSDETEPISLDDDFFFVQDGNGDSFDLYSFDPVSLVPRRLYQSSYPSSNGLALIDGKSAIWSPVQDDVLYEYGAPSDTELWHWTFSSLTTPPGGSTLDKDFTSDPNCNVLPATPEWYSALTVSKTGDFFALSTSSGAQDTAYIALVWQKSTNTCAWINTQTGQYGGNMGGSGTISGWTAEYIHNLKISASGTYLRLDYANNDAAVWEVGTSDWAYCSTSVSPYPCNGGHLASGYNVFAVGNGINLSPARPRNYALHPFLTPLTFNFLFASGPPKSPCSNDTHVSWNDDNPVDTMPISMSGDACGYNEYPFIDEVNSLATNGSQMAWRFSRTWSMEDNTEFVPEHSIGQGSYDGKFFMLATDWGGELGNGDYLPISSWSRSSDVTTITSSAPICHTLNGGSVTITNAPMGPAGTSINGTWIGNFTTINPPTAAPILSTSTTGGLIPANTTVYVEVTYETANNACDTTPSTVASITTGSGTSTNTVTVTSPSSESNATYYGTFACAGSSGCAMIIQNATAIGTNSTIGDSSGSYTSGGLVIAGPNNRPVPTQNGGNLDTMTFTQNAVNDSNSTAAGYILPNVCETLTHSQPSCRFDAFMIETK